jgi:hypothetical protein
MLASHLLPYNFLFRMSKIVEQQHHVLFLYSFHRYFFTKNQMFPSSQTSTAPIGLAVPSFFSRLVQKTGIDIFNKALKFVYSFNCIFIFVSLIILVLYELNFAVLFYKMVNKGVKSHYTIKEKVSFSRIKTVTLGVLKRIVVKIYKNHSLERSKSKIVF